MEIKGIIFDMDGIMVDTEKHYNRIMCRAANELGYPMKREHSLLLRSLDIELACPLMKTYFGEEYDHRVVRELYHKYVDEYFAEHEIEVKPGLFELLEYLKKEHYLFCVATSSGRERTEKFLGKIHALEYFDHICSGEEFEHSKPAPDIYIQAAKCLGLKPKECIALEDSPNGITSAYRAGCKPVMIPDLTKPDEETKKMLFAEEKSLDKVIGLLENSKI